MRDPFAVFWGTIALLALSALGWWYWQMQVSSAPRVAGAPAEATSTPQEEESSGIAIPSWMRSDAPPSLQREAPHPPVPNAAPLPEPTPPAPSRRT